MLRVFFTFCLIFGRSEGMPPKNQQTHLSPCFSRKFDAVHVTAAQQQIVAHAKVAVVGGRWGSAPDYKDVSPKAKKEQEAFGRERLEKLRQAVGHNFSDQSLYAALMYQQDEIWKRLKTLLQEKNLLTGLPYNSTAQWIQVASENHLILPDEDRMLHCDREWANLARHTVRWGALKTISNNLEDGAAASESGSVFNAMTVSRDFGDIQVSAAQQEVIAAAKKDMIEKYKPDLVSKYGVRDAQSITLNQAYNTMWRNGKASEKITSEKAEARAYQFRRKKLAALLEAVRISEPGFSAEQLSVGLLHQQGEMWKQLGKWLKKKEEKGQWVGTQKFSEVFASETFETWISLAQNKNYIRTPLSPDQIDLLYIDCLWADFVRHTPWDREENPESVDVKNQQTSRQGSNVALNSNGIFEGDADPLLHPGS